MPVHFLLSEPADSSAASSFSAFWTCRFFCNQFIFYFLNLQILLQPVYFLLFELADSSATSLFSAFWTCRFFCSQFIFCFLNLQILLQPVYFLLSELADSSAASLFSTFWTCSFLFIFYVHWTASLFLSWRAWRMLTTFTYLLGSTGQDKNK